MTKRMEAADDLYKALKLARRIMIDFGLWTPGKPGTDTETIQNALKKAENRK